MKKAKVEKRRRLGPPAASRRFAAWPVVAVVACATLGLFLWRTWEAAETRSSNSSPQTNESNDASLPEPAQDQALRREQLQAAEKLLAEFPQNHDVIYLAG